MNLIIDIGNSSIKVAVSEGGKIVRSFREESLSSDKIERILSENPGINAAIVCSVRGEDDWGADGLNALLRERLPFVITLDHTTPAPIKNLYSTPETLGYDRLAAAVGAMAMFPGENVLTVDFGTAITIDMVTAAGEFVGGNISPGAQTRFRALNAFTGSLPLRELTDGIMPLGDSTNTAVEGGVVNGIVYEIEGYIRDISARFGKLRVIFAGGDANFFAKRLKNPIFVTCDLVICGLDHILEYNKTTK